MAACSTRGSWWNALGWPPGNWGGNFSFSNWCCMRWYSFRLAGTGNRDIPECITVLWRTLTVFSTPRPLHVALTRGVWFIEITCSTSRFINDRGRLNAKINQWETTEHDCILGADWSKWCWGTWPPHPNDKWSDFPVDLGNHAVQTTSQWHRHRS